MALFLDDANNQGRAKAYSLDVDTSILGEGGGVGTTTLQGAPSPDERDVCTSSSHPLDSPMMPSPDESEVHTPWIRL